MRLRTVLLLVVTFLFAGAAMSQNVDGTKGDIIVNGDAAHPTFGVVLRPDANDPSAAARLGGANGKFVVFSAASAELLRVQNNGNVGIGTPAPGALLHLAKQAVNGLGPELILENTGNAIGDTAAITFTDTGTPRGQLYAGLHGYDAGGTLEYRSLYPTTRTFLRIGGFGDMQINGRAIPLQVVASAHYGLPTSVEFVDLAYYYGLPHGIRMQMPGNSDIRVSGLQIGRWSEPVIQSLSGPLQLNPDTRYEVTVPAQFTVGDLDGDARMAVISGDNPGNANAPTLVLGRKDGNNSNLTEFAFSVDEQNNALKLTHLAAGATIPIPLLTITGGAVPQLSFSGAIIGAVYQDLAEWVPATSDVPPGTVVVLNPDRTNEVMPSDRSYDERVAGVVSAQPGLLLGAAGAGKEMIATTGRVRVRVDATQPIRVGDLLVSSSRPGMAMRSQPIDLGGVSIHRPGTIIGKALEPLESGQGEILVLLSLQ